jgi:hypothetical protein
MPYVQSTGGFPAWEMLLIRHVRQDRAAAKKLGAHHTAPLPPAQSSPKAQLSYQTTQDALHKTVHYPGNTPVHTGPKNG